MLAEQLQSLEEIMGRFGRLQTESRANFTERISCCSEVIKNNWREAHFSNTDDCSLRRYFNYHLGGISKISDTLYLKTPDNPNEIYDLFQNALLGLTDHLIANYGDYLNVQAKAGIVFQLRWQDELQGLIAQTENNLKNAGISDHLKSCLTKFLAKIDHPIDDSRLNYAALKYRKHLMRGLSEFFSGQVLSETPIKEYLLSINFNHLGYYNYLQQDYQLRASKFSEIEKLTFYETELMQLKVTPEQSRYQYHPDWPSLRSMLINFLEEEIKLHQSHNQITGAAGGQKCKMALNLSVAQLACLIRVMYEDACFGDQNLQEIFKFFAAHFRTKRQEQISAHSLSKEYYSIEQVTAAVMRDKFSKMIKWLNQNFFPA